MPTCAGVIGAHSWRSSDDTARTIPTARPRSERLAGIPEHDAPAERKARIRTHTWARTKSPPPRSLRRSTRSTPERTGAYGSCRNRRPEREICGRTQPRPRTQQTVGRLKWRGIETLERIVHAISPAGAGPSSAKASIPSAYSTQREIPGSGKRPCKQPPLLRTYGFKFRRRPISVPQLQPNDKFEQCGTDTSISKPQARPAAQATPHRTTRCIFRLTGQTTTRYLVRAPYVRDPTRSPNGRSAITTHSSQSSRKPHRIAHPKTTPSFG